MRSILYILLAVVVLAVSGGDYGRATFIVAYAIFITLCEYNIRMLGYAKQTMEKKHVRNDTDT